MYGAAGPNNSPCDQPKSPQWRARAAIMVPTSTLSWGTSIFGLLAPSWQPRMIPSHAVLRAYGLKWRYFRVEGQNEGCWRPGSAVCWLQVHGIDALHRYELHIGRSSERREKRKQCIMDAKATDGHERALRSPPHPPEPFMWYP